jgi:hypothetical protein
MTMREKMARAMYVLYCAAGELLKQGTCPAYEDMDPLARFQFDQYADAALDALLEPTPGMMKALHNDIHPNWLGEKSYRALIVAAKEGK